MPKKPNGQNRFDPQARLQAFIDCVARILARQWLHDQRHNELKPRDSEKTTSNHTS